jgi:acyl dehydratase
VLDNGGFEFCEGCLFVIFVSVFAPWVGENVSRDEHMTSATRTALAEGEGIGPTIGEQYVSAWFPVGQNQIDGFCEATGDNQWIHRSNVNPEQKLFGGPVAHGLLVVSLAINLARESGALPEGTWVLYGFDKLRFRAPVRSGARIRCLTAIQDCRELGHRRLLNLRFVIEIAGQTIPAITMNCSLLCLPEDPGL